MLCIGPANSTLDLMAFSDWLLQAPLSTTSGLTTTSYNNTKLNNSPSGCPQRCITPSTAMGISYTHRLETPSLHHHKGIHHYNGIQCLIQTFRELYWVPNILQPAQKVGRECHPYNLGKDITHTAGPSGKHDAYHPRQVFTLGTLRPLPAYSGYRCALTFVDTYSNILVDVPTNYYTACSVARVLCEPVAHPPPTRATKDENTSPMPPSPPPPETQPCTPPIIPIPPSPLSSLSLHNCYHGLPTPPLNPQLVY